MCGIIGVGERLHKVLGQIDLGTLDSGERSLPFGLLVTCLIRTYVYLLFFFSYKCFNSKRIQIYVMNSTCLRIKCVKNRTAFYLLSKMFRP